MAEYKFYLKQPPASELVDKLLNVIEEVSPNCHISYFTINTNIGNFNFVAQNPPPQISAFKNRRESGGILSFLNDRPYLDITNLSINTDNEFNFSVRTDKGSYIVLATSGTRESNPQTISPITDSLNKHFNLLIHQEFAESVLRASEKNALQ